MKTFVLRTPSKRRTFTTSVHETEQTSKHPTTSWGAGMRLKVVGEGTLVHLANLMV